MPRHAGDCDKRPRHHADPHDFYVASVLRRAAQTRQAMLDGKKMLTRPPVGSSGKWSNSREDMLISFLDFHAAYSKLTQEQQCVLYAYHVEGLTQWELARQRDTSPRTVMRLVDAATDRLIAFLEAI